MTSPSLSLPALCFSRRFGPLLVTLFFGAFTDNLLKNALVVLILFGSIAKGAGNPQILVTLAAGFFILPYILFSSLAGQLADRYEKSMLVRRIKWAEVLLMSLAAYGFYSGNVWLLLSLLFGTGAQSAFFSPLKYSLIPDHLHKNEILGGNAMLEAATFLSILLGTITGGLLIMLENGPFLVSCLLVIFALVGVVASYFIPPSGPYAPSLHIRINQAAETWGIIGVAIKSRVLGFSILGISWFWFLGATFLSQFPAFTRDYLHGNEEVVTLLLTAFSLGIALGSFTIHAILKSRISPAYVVPSMLLLAVFVCDLALTSMALPAADPLLSASQFLAERHNMRILFDLVMIAICGGVYIVPLNALLQTYSAAESRARTIAANNILNAAFMALSAAMIAGLLAFNITIPKIFLGLAAASLTVALLCFRQIRRSHFKQLLYK